MFYSHTAYYTILQRWADDTAVDNGLFSVATVCHSSMPLDVPRALAVGSAGKLPNATCEPDTQEFGFSVFRV